MPECDRLCLVSFAANLEHSNLPPLSRINDVIAHAASRARADASVVLGIGCMTAFRRPKQVDTARCTLQKLKETCDLMKNLFGYMQQPGR